MATNRRIRNLLVAVTILAGLVLAQGGRNAWSAEALDGFMGKAEVGQLATVEGVVSAVWPKQGRLGLIDAEEFKRCGVVTCAQMTLPVLWDGEMPLVASIVHVTGKVTKKGMRLMFEASALDTVQPPPETEKGE